MKWVEDRRENLLAAGKSRHEHADVRIAFDADGTIQAVGIDFVSDCGAYPTPWPVMTAAAVGALFPGSVPRAAGELRVQDHLHEHRRAHRVPRPVAVRDRWRARCCSTSRRARWRHRSGRAAAPQPAARRRPAVHQPERHDLRQHLAARDVRAGARDARLRRVPGRAGRGARRTAATSASGISNYVEPSTPGFGYYATEAATIRIEPSGTVNVYIAGGSTGNSIETTVVQLTADALGVDIDDVATIQGDTALTGFGAGAAGAAAAR